MRLIIVSGRSGSGKSTALNVLEDNGFYCIDNLPAGLLPELAERALLHTELLHPQVAVSIDARNLPSQLKRFPELLEEVRARHIQCDVLYLDADDETLLKRFSETRRRHPLTNESRSLAEAIRDEELLLAAIIDHADLKIDTTHLNLYQLRDMLKLRLLNKPEPGHPRLPEQMAATLRRQQPRVRHHRHRLHRRPSPLGVPSRATRPGAQGAAEEPAGPSPGSRLGIRKPMPAREVTIINKLGLHARAAAKFVAVANRFPCKIRVGRCPATLVDGKSIMAVMMLAASKGTTVHLHADGEQEEEALDALVALIDDYFEEGE